MPVLYRTNNFAYTLREIDIAVAWARVRTFTVLCRIDAYADYVAEVEATSAVEAAELARENHGDYKWEHDGTAEFDARFYVTLDADGDEIEATHVGDM